MLFRSPERNSAPGATVDGTSRPAGTSQSNPSAPDPATVAGQNSPGITLPREKGGPVTDVDESGKAGPLTPAPFFTAPEEQQPAKGTVPAETAPIPNKEAGIPAPAPAADSTRKETPVQGAGVIPGTVTDGSLKPADGPADLTPIPGQRTTTIQGMISTAKRLP